MSQDNTSGVGSARANPFARYALIVAYVCIAGAIAEVLGYQWAQPSRAFWLSIVPIALASASLVVLERRRTILSCAVFLVVGGFAQYWLSVTMLSPLPPAVTASANVLLLVPVALVAGAGAANGPSLTALWCTIGFADGQLASWAAAVVSHTPTYLDLLALGTAVAMVVITLVMSTTATPDDPVRRELDRAVADEELFALRYRIEVRAAALMHDMVLSHLAAVAAEPDGPLQPRLRGQIENDLAVLVSEEWLSDPTPEFGAAARLDWQRSWLLKAVQEARELPLQVAVTGDLGAVARISGECDAALGLAVKQCLVNVLRHAAVDNAEVVVIASNDAVTVMVIDAGRGFSEQEVASDRLGLRQSVRRRVESVGGDVRVWSTPGRGTSVILRVPADARESDGDD